MEYCSHSIMVYNLKTMFRLLNVPPFLGGPTSPFEIHSPSQGMHFIRCVLQFKLIGIHYYATSYKVSQMFNHYDDFNPFSNM
jgi:hypothetical protein